MSSTRQPGQKADGPPVFGSEHRFRFDTPTIYHPKAETTIHRFSIQIIAPYVHDQPTVGYATAWPETFTYGTYLRNSPDYCRTLQTSQTAIHRRFGSYHMLPRAQLTYTRLHPIYIESLSLERDRTTRVIMSTL